MQRYPRPRYPRPLVIGVQPLLPRVQSAPADRFVTLTGKGESPRGDGPDDQQATEPSVREHGDLPRAWAFRQPGRLESRCGRSVGPTVARSRGATTVLPWCFWEERQMPTDPGGFSARVSHPKTATPASARAFSAQARCRAWAAALQALPPTIAHAVSSGSAPRGASAPKQQAPDRGHQKIPSRIDRKPVRQILRGSSHVPQALTSRLPPSAGPQRLELRRVQKEPTAALADVELDPSRLTGNQLLPTDGATDTRLAPAVELSGPPRPIQLVRLVRTTQDHRQGVPFDPDSTTDRAALELDRIAPIGLRTSSALGTVHWWAECTRRSRRCSAGTSFPGECPSKRVWPDPWCERWAAILVTSPARDPLDTSRGGGRQRRRRLGRRRQRGRSRHPAPHSAGSAHCLSRSGAKNLAGSMAAIRQAPS